MLKILGRLAVTAVVFAGIVAVLSWRADRAARGGRDPAKVAAAAGASSCSSSGYYLKSRLDGEKTVIYDCVIAGRWRCVTEKDGLASDSTLMVEAAFASVLNADRPACLG